MMLPGAVKKTKRHKLSKKTYDKNKTKNKNTNDININYNKTTKQTNTINHHHQLLTPKYYKTQPQ